MPRFLLATLTWRRGDVILAESGEQIDPFNFILVRGKQSELQTLSLISRNPLNKTTFPVIPPKWKLFLMLVNRSPIDPMKLPTPTTESPPSKHASGIHATH